MSRISELTGPTYSFSYPTGEIFQVEVAGLSSAGWVDLSEHSTLEAASALIEHRRLTDDTARRYRIRKFVAVEIIDPPPSTTCSCWVTNDYRRNDPKCLVHNQHPATGLQVTA